MDLDIRLSSRTLQYGATGANVVGSDEYPKQFSITTFTDNYAQENLTRIPENLSAPLFTPPVSVTFCNIDDPIEPIPSRLSSVITKFERILGTLA
ncbi:hypothetical protein FRB97_005688, partial [Tulasnella sp. 331]